tara:strand:+ start:555 stop:1322 length:768 start_codon:yes stop_codon:yes gene_type:complete
MKNNCIILSHVFIREDEEYKQDIIKKTVDTFKQLNPDAYIILTGHGVQPIDSIRENVNFIHWEDLIKESEIDCGHPYFVSIAYEHAITKGFTHAFKSRADCPSIIPNICDSMHSILIEEDTKMVVTEMTSLKKLFIGDLFIYGDLNPLLCSWSRWDNNHSGLQNFANNWMEDHNLERNDLTDLNPPDHWKKLVFKTISFRDMKDFGCINVADFWHVLKDVKLTRVKNWKNFLWGVKPGYAIQNTREEFYLQKQNG